MKELINVACVQNLSKKGGCLTIRNNFCSQGFYIGAAQAVCSFNVKMKRFKPMPIAQHKKSKDFSLLFFEEIKKQSSLYTVVSTRKEMKFTYFSDHVHSRFIDFSTFVNMNSHCFSQTTYSR